MTGRAITQVGLRMEVLIGGQVFTALRTKTPHHQLLLQEPHRDGMLAELPWCPVLFTMA